MGRAVPVPDRDAACQQALNGALVEIGEDVGIPAAPLLIISLVLLTLRDSLSSWHQLVGVFTSSLWAVSSLPVMRPRTVVLSAN